MSRRFMPKRFGARILGQEGLEAFCLVKGKLVKIIV
jgi:hypothetical protein